MLVPNTFKTGFRIVTAAILLSFHEEESLALIGDTTL